MPLFYQARALEPHPETQYKRNLKRKFIDFCHPLFMLIILNTNCKIISCGLCRIYLNLYFCTTILFLFFQLNSLCLVQQETWNIFEVKMLFILRRSPNRWSFVTIYAWQSVNSWQNSAPSIQLPSLPRWIGYETANTDMAVQKSRVKQRLHRSSFNSDSWARLYHAFNDDTDVLCLHYWRSTMLTISLRSQYRSGLGSSFEYV